jgi:hypothetical protein
MKAEVLAYQRTDTIITIAGFRIYPRGRTFLKYD